MGQEKENKELLVWVKDIVNHYWHTAEVGKTVEKFLVSKTMGVITIVMEELANMYYNGFIGSYLTSVKINLETKAQSVSFMVINKIQVSRVIGLIVRNS